MYVYGLGHIELVEQFFALTLHIIIITNDNYILNTYKSQNRNQSKVPKLNLNKY